MSFEFNGWNLQRQIEAELRRFADLPNLGSSRGSGAVEAAGEHLAEILMTSAGPGVGVLGSTASRRLRSGGITRRGSPYGRCW